MSAQCVLELAGREVPDPRDAILAPGREPRAIGGCLERDHPPRRTRKHGHGSAGRCVPDPDSIAACGVDAASVAAECAGEHRTRMVEDSDPVCEDLPEPVHEI